jgi:hypothetical protein
LQHHFYLKKQFCILFLSGFIGTAIFSQQTKVSLASDASILRSFKKEQQYWAIGQTVSLHFNFTPKEGAYAWLSYYSNGNFSNALTATAKTPATAPQAVNYNNKAQLRFKHISLGWKKYLKGDCTSEKGWNLYGYAGFGLMLGAVTNIHSAGIDTAIYVVPVLSGKANYKRLTADLGLGAEIPIGADVFFYTEARALVPTSDYPSKYLFINKKAPFTAAFNLGIRILL